MRFGGIVAPYNGYISLTLGPYSSFSFSVGCVLLSRFDPNVQLINIFKHS